MSGTLSIKQLPGGDVTITTGSVVQVVDIAGFGGLALGVLEADLAAEAATRGAADATLQANIDGEATARAAADAAHVVAADPHGDRAYADADVATHNNPVSTADPHSGLFGRLAAALNTFTGTVAAKLRDSGGEKVNVEAFGAVADAQVVSGVTATNGSAVVTGSGFVAGDVGKVAILVDPVTATKLYTSIASFQSSTQVTLAAPWAGTTDATLVLIWGTDNGPAIQNAVNAVPTQGGEIAFPAGTTGRYLVATPIVATDRASLRFRGLAGRYYRGLAVITNVGGVGLWAGAAGMTIVQCASTTTLGMHKGPFFNDLGFDDPTVTVPAIVASSITLQAGTTYRIVTATRHGLSNGEYVNLTGFVPTAYNGRFLVTGVVDATTVDVNLTTNPAAVTTVGKVQFDGVRGTSAVGLHIKKHTRWSISRCTFYGCAIGAKLEPGGTDVSWGKVEQGTCIINAVGVQYSGNGGAQSSVVSGGDFTVASGQTGIDVPDDGSGTNAGIRITPAPKFDIGKNSATSGFGAFGIRMRQGTGTKVEAVIEMIYGTGVELGASANVTGSVWAHCQGNSGSTPTNGVTGTGVSLVGTGDTSSTAVHGVDVWLTGSVLAVGVEVGAHTRFCKIAGEQTQCTVGVQVDAGAFRNTIQGFTSNQLGTGTHIVDNGSETYTAFNHTSSAADDPFIRMGVTTAAREVGADADGRGDGPYPLHSSATGRDYLTWKANGIWISVEGTA